MTEYAKGGPIKSTGVDADHPPIWLSRCLYEDLGIAAVRVTNVGCAHCNDPECYSETAHRCPDCRSYERPCDCLVVF